MSEVMMTSLFAFALAMAVAFGATPAAKLFAEKMGAVDVPRDDRRMNKKPVPRAGGLAIFAGFIVGALVIGHITGELLALYLGALVVVILGVADDIHSLKPMQKMIGQIVAALIPTLCGIRIERFSNPFSASGSLDLGVFSIPITIIWIVGIINAVNFIDGLDGLAVGISTIASFTMFTIAILVSDASIAVITAALAGACLGFLPYNANPAKIFMGDTGSMFLGYILATLSIEGLFKLYAVVSFMVPFIILGLPIFDTGFAIIRRLLKGQSPLQADRGHVHHRLIDMGFDQKQSVSILYALSVVLGLSAVVLTTSGEWKIIIIAVVAFLSIFIGLSITAYERRHQKELNQAMERKLHIEHLFDDDEPK